MEEMNNISGYRSVYMAFGIFKTGNAASAPQAKAENSNAPEFLSALNLAMDKTADQDLTESASENALKKSGETIPYDNGAFLSYTRIITANMPDFSMASNENGNLISPFDLKGGNSELKITISVSGDSRIYTASGTDKDGKAFSKEIDPYNVDPTDTDYAGFAVLCQYIRDTEGMADNAMKAVKDVAPADISENGNYLMKVSYTAESTGNLAGAKKLFEKMQTFFEKLSSPSSKASTGSIFDELQEMIDRMIQQMLNEIVGIDDTVEEEELEEKAEIAEESVEKADEAAAPDMGTLEESLGVENATAV